MTLFLKRKAYLSILIILVAFFSLQYSFAYGDIQQEYPTVLVLHSYHPTLSWTSSVSEGILQTFDTSLQNATIHMEYMDWKRHPTQENLDNVYAALKYKYQDKKIDIILTSDDAALEFALEHRKEILSDAPIVFCGVFNETAIRIKNQNENLTGVIDRMDPEGSIKAARYINPHIKKIYVIHDHTESGIGAYEEVVSILQARMPDVTVESLSNLIIKDISRNLPIQDQESAFIMTTFMTDGEGTTIDLDNAGALISQHLSQPLYDIYDMTLGQGIIGGSLLSGSSQGSAGAELVIKVLQGEDAGTIPLIEEKTAQLMFDYDVLERFNISLEQIPPGSIIVNKPFSFYQTYKSLVWMVVAIILFLLFLICLLGINTFLRKRAEYELIKSNAELAAINEELIASEDELRVQYQTITDNQEEIKFLAYYDPLTNLPNRRFLGEWFEQLVQMNLDEEDMGALFFVDTDNFKNINDSFGHSVGDQLLIELGKRFLALKADKDALVSRLGGDEFIIFTYGHQDRQEIDRVAHEILTVFDEPFIVDDHVIYMSGSMGITIYPDHGRTFEDLHKNADTAMYKAKYSGKRAFSIFNESMNKEVTEKTEMENSLRNALSQNEMQVYYQPQVNIETGKICGFEALLRWFSKDHGFVSPIKFIKLAEETGLILSIGEWVLRRACIFNHTLKQKGYENLKISVNISPYQIMQNGFVDTIIGIFKETNTPYEDIALEVTETILMQNFESNAKKLLQLKEVGIMIYLDDFGTGYSSLSYLHKLPINTLKIDKSFVDNICLDIAGKDLTKTIVLLAHDMDLKVVAEGVETEEQFEKLASYHCDMIQGYLISKPVPEKDIYAMLQG